ncbi:putative Ig domain-containing protein [Agarivorans sp. TSD2052]|uniref:putative Ig domain-containing protein n=1 Tax=Agarivorans sp. TSD2052 TaxID=2937286 RepID=UPI00200FD5C3|nr:putative Ig domain-containing protein [Agarivorans sp. TSD2052]UPW19412.1 putative Ig domain-containing protein [Agarivorans sp. TSD2052]
MKKISFLATAMTLALSGCGSDDSNQSNPTPTPEQITITAIDGYLYKAKVYIGDNCDIYKGSTDQNGQLTLDLTDDIIDQKVCITAIPSETIDITRGVVVDEFTLAAPSVPESADEPVIVSPMTNLVVEQIEYAEENGTKMTQEEAEQAVVESFNINDNVVYTAEDIFGDYVAVAEGEGEEAEKAKAVNVVGETLVDNDDVLVDVEDQLSVISAISQETSDIIADETQELSDDYAPIVHTDENGYQGIETNHRPSVNLEFSQPEAFELGESVSYDLSALFSDQDTSDVLTYSVDAQDKAGALIEGSTLTITPTETGVHNVLAYASDGVSRSYPLVIEVEIFTPNTAPVLNEQNTVQSDLDALNLTATQSVDERVSINNLFIDADNDVLTYDVTDVTGNGLSINADNESAELHIIGTPEQEGVFTFHVTANDDHHPSVSALLKLNVAEAPNAAPELNTEVQQRIADELTALNLQVGNVVNSDINLDQLFIDDDVLTLTAQHTIEGVNTTIHGSTLTLTGTPESSGDANLKLYADDGVNPPELALFTVPVAEQDSSEPTDPVVPAPAARFEERHFIGGEWRMGEIGEDEFDLEMGWASLMKSQDQHYFCWKKSIDIATPQQLAQLELPENKTLIISPNSDDCWPVEIQPDGTLLGDGEVYTPVYTSENNGDYQVVFKIENDLFWLDSTENLPFNAMLPVPAMDNTVYQSMDWDDSSGADEVRFLSADFTVNQQSIYSSEVTKSGTFKARELDGYGSSLPMHWTGTWEISTSGDGKELLSYNSLNSADYEQHYMRQFNQGELRIVVGQHGDEIGQKVDIVLESTDDALLRSINTVWDPKSTLPSPLDPNLLEGKTFFLTEHGSSNGEVDLTHQVVWCDAFKFENGEYYVNQRNASNNTTCPTDADLVVEGSYTIDAASANIKVNAGFYSTTYTVIGDASELSQGALSVVSYGERKEHFTDKAAVEARLNASSNAGDNSLGFYLPTNRDGYSQFGQVTLSLTESNATITFEKAVDGDDVTCSLISDYFESFWLSSGDKADYNSTCSNKAQGSASVTIPRTVYGTKGESATLYSIIGTSNNKYQESVKYSIQPNVAQTK